jgi:transposase
MVERAFRTSKSLFVTRPIFHKLDETIRGHVPCSFLALVLKKELEDSIANMGKSATASGDVNHRNAQECQDRRLQCSRENENGFYTALVQWNGCSVTQ